MYVNVYTCILVRGVSFAKYSLFYRALVQKRPIISFSFIDATSRSQPIPVHCTQLLMLQRCTAFARLV